MRFAIPAVALTLVLVGPAVAQTEGPIAIVKDALLRGYGGVCSLAMEPVAQGGYFPCVDIGPYRFVEEYGRTTGFVIMDGQPPFRILVQDQEGTHFEVQGPWVQDLPVRVQDWFHAEVEGGRAEAELAQAAADRNAAAGGAVDAYIKSLEPPASPAPVATAQEAPNGLVTPQVIYILPPGYQVAQPQTDATQAMGAIMGGSPGQQPMMPAPGGILVAPGVVGYPTAN